MPPTPQAQLMENRLKFVSGGITDIEGNEYPMIKIGTQFWMAENLETTKFNDGSVIENITDNYGWTEHYGSGIQLVR